MIEGETDNLYYKTEEDTANLGRERRRDRGSMQRKTKILRS